MSPRLFHLLGRWQENRLTFDALPNRPDLFKSGSKSVEDCYFLLNQVEWCQEADHNHFPNADTGIFPGAEHIFNLEGPPEPDYYNWQPWVREQELLNWNLEEEIEAEANYAGEPAPMRFRRQAPPQPQPQPKTPLLENESRIGLTVQKGARKWTFKRQYSAFAITLVNSSLAKKNVPQVRAYFQDVWSEANTWNFQMLPVESELGASVGAANPLYKVHINLPPHCSLTFSDVSVLQALGFDLVNVPNDRRSIRSKVVPSTQQTLYYFDNPSEKSRLFTSIRPIPNLPIHKLRALAKRERTKLPKELRDTAPMIEHETEELDTTLELTYACTPPEILTFEAEIAAEPEDPANRIAPYLDFFRQIFWYLSQHTGVDYNIFSFEPCPIDVNALRIAFVRPNLEGTLDRFTVELEFGPKVLSRMPRLARYQGITWNLGRAASIDLPVLSIPLTAAQRAEAKRLAAEEAQKKADAAKAAEAVKRENLGPQPTEADVLVRAGPSRATAQDIVTEPEDVAVLDPLTKPEEEQVVEPVAADIFEQDIAEADTAVRVLDWTPPKEEEPRPVDFAILPDEPTVVLEPQPQPAGGTTDEPTDVVLAQPPPAVTPPPAVAQAPQPTDVVVVVVAPVDVIAAQPPPPAPAVDVAAQPPPPAAGAVDVIVAVQPEPPRANTPPVLPPPEIVVVPPPEDVIVVDEPVPEGEEGEEGEEEGEGEPPEPEPPRPPSPFRRSRLRFLAGTGPRKRRWNRGENEQLDFPDGFLLVLENAEREDDFITDYGRCCIAATVLNNRVVSKNKCYVNWESLQHLTFQVFDSKHLNLIRARNSQLVKIELLMFN